MSEEDTDAGRHANLSRYILSTLTLSCSLLQNLNRQRGIVAPDLGIKSVIAYVLGCRVLERISFVNCPRKQARTVRRLEVMLTGGMAKKRKRIVAKNETRDRVFLYVESCVLSFITEDFTTLYGEQCSTKELRSDVCKGDEFLDDLLSVMSDSTCLLQILSISVFSFVTLLAELMMEGSLKSMEESEFDQSKWNDFEPYEMYCSLEKIYPGGGVLVSGDGRPMFSSSSVHGRDGELAKIALSNTALAHALWMGARMRVPALTRKKKDEESDDITFESFFPYVIDEVVSSNIRDREYLSIMEEAREFLEDSPTDAFVGMNIINRFLQGYEALRCNRVTTQAFRGAGVLGASKDIPDVVRCRRLETKTNASSMQYSAVKEVEKDPRKIRRLKDPCLDSQTESIRRNGVKVVRCVCSLGKELCSFFYKAVRLAEKIVLGVQRDEEQQGFHFVRDTPFQDFTLGIFSRNLSGGITVLYEDYIYLSLMCHFDERDGVAKTLVRIGVRLVVSRLNSNARKRKLKRGKSCEKKEICGVGREEVSVEEEDWIA